MSIDRTYFTCCVVERSQSAVEHAAVDGSIERRGGGQIKKVIFEVRIDNRRTVAAGASVAKATADSMTAERGGLTGVRAGRVDRCMSAGGRLAASGRRVDFIFAICHR